MNGFLGTEASLLSDLSLIATLILGAAAAFGGIQARKQKFSKHCPVMAVAALLNWIPVIAVMIPALIALLAGESPQPSGVLSLVPLFHGVLGLITQLLMTYTVLRMVWLLKIPPINTRLLMKVTMALWMVTILGGLGVYLSLYLS